MVRQKDERVRIYSRRGADFTDRFPRIVDFVMKLNVRSIHLDGEGIVCDRNGLAQFDWCIPARIMNKSSYAPSTCSSSMATIFDPSH
jgi:ATP-dependent DNA ligase